MFRQQWFGVEDRRQGSDEKSGEACARQGGMGAFDPSDMSGEAERWRA
jgi:hypothetical protein